MGASMWLMSPNFRTQLGSIVGDVGDVIRDKIDGRGAKKDAKAQGKFEKLASKGRADQLSDRWQRRLDKIEHAERGHRLPFTAQSAAMTEVALAEAAYTDMRRPGADLRVIRDRYESALSALYEYAEDDGIDREDVSRSMRVIVGQRLEREPELASVFRELGHSRFAKSEPREVYINGTTETATVWTGDFVDSYAGRTISSGSFSLRPVMGVNEHRLSSAETLAADLCSASTVAQMNDTLSQYVVAASAARYPDVVEEITDPSTRRRFSKARTMFTSMQADGLTPDEQHFAYSAAYIDAIEVAQRLKPELSAEWVAQYGENWRERVAEDMGRFNDMGAAAEREKRGPQRTPEWAFTDARYDREEASAAFTTEDVIDAEVVEHEHPGSTRSAASNPGDARRAPRTLDWPVYEGELIPGDTRGSDDDEAINGEVIETGELKAGPARAAILAATASTPVAGVDEPDSSTASGASAKVRRARVNQHYNEVETGGLTGIGSDDAAPLQDVDFQLG
jgi:hypothetical protein